MNWPMIIAGIAITGLVAIGGVAAWYVSDVAADIDRFLYSDYADRYRHAGDASWADDDEG